MVGVESDSITTTTTTSITTALPVPETQRSSDTVSAGQPYRQYDNTFVSGSGLTIFGDVGTLSQPQSTPEVTKFGLCLGAAPQIDPTYFVGRAAEIEEISRLLQPGTICAKQRRVVLGGIGGVGKTQLAITYAERHQQSHDSIFWLNATSLLTLYVSLRLLAGRLIKADNLERLSDEQILGRVHEWLSHPRNTQWLLIFDNYDEPTQFDINTFCPFAAHGSIIITTRLPDRIRLSSDHIRVQPLYDLEESLNILQKRSHRQNIHNDLYARRLAQRLGGLPLALTTAAVYLSKKASITFQQYLEIYEQRWNVDPQRPLQLQEYQDRTLYTTWDLSYVQLASDDLDASQMLRLLAYFDNQDISYELLGAGIMPDFPWLQRSVSSVIDFENTMTTLVDYGFIEVQAATKSYNMHNCIHDWTLANLNKPLNKPLYWYAFSCIAALVEKYDRDSWGHLQCRHLVPHATRLTLAWFAQDLLLYIIEADWLESAVHIAGLLKQQAQFVAAEQIYMRVLAGKERTLGPDHISTLHIAWVIGRLYRNQSKLDEAEQMLKRVLAGYTKALGEDNINTLKVNWSLSSLYADQGKLHEAKQMQELVVAGMERKFGPDDRQTLDAINNLGRRYYSLEELTKAEEMFTRALVGTEKAFGPDHPETLDIIHNLSGVFVSRGELKKAEQMLDRAFTGTAKVMGPDHPRTLHTVHSLGDLYKRQGRLDKAEQMFLQALAGEEKALGPNHHNTLDMRRSLGLLYKHQGRLDEAEQMYSRALDGAQQALGLEHGLTRSITKCLTILYKDQGKLDEAERLSTSTQRMSTATRSEAPRQRIR